MFKESFKLYNSDLNKTINNRNNLFNNINLLKWYSELYTEIFISISNIENKKILEIGSGTSPLKSFYPTILTSDILDLDYLDIIFDCHSIDKLKNIPDKSLDIIILTNVLHHLHDPLLFLKNAEKKLKCGAEIVLIEPYFSILSYPIYKFLHHEPTEFNIDSPILNNIDGPLSTSNQTIPYLIFFKKRKWIIKLKNYYSIDNIQIKYFTSLSYFITGGISRNFHFPFYMFKFYFYLDRYLANKFPKLFASFFYVRLTVVK